MIPAAHVGGVPVEELLPFAPVVWAALAARVASGRVRRRRR
jgi:hypothetical protein